MRGTHGAADRLKRAIDQHVTAPEDRKPDHASVAPRPLNWRIVVRAHFRAEGTTLRQKNTCVVHIWPPEGRTTFPAGTGDDLGDAFRQHMQAITAPVPVATADWTSAEKNRIAFSLGGAALVPSWEGAKAADQEDLMETFAVTITGITSRIGWEQIIYGRVMGTLDSLMKIRENRDANSETVSNIGREGERDNGKDRGDTDPRQRSGRRHRRG